MSMVCACTECRAKFKADEKYAGRKVKCPKCKATIQLPADDAPAAPTKTKPAKPAKPRSPVTAKPVPKPVSPVTAKPLPTKPVSPVTSKTESKEPGSTPVVPVESDQPSATSSSGFPNIALDDKPRKSARKNVKPRKKTPPWIWLVGAGALTVVAMCGGGIFLVVSMFMPVKNLGGPTMITSVGTVTASNGEAVLVLVWPESERTDAAVRIDGEKEELSLFGDLQYRLAPGDHEVVIQRRGYEHIEVALALDSGEVRTYQPKWKSMSLALNATAGALTLAPEGFQGWLQDIQMAERESNEEQKHLFVVFGCSDASARTQHFARNTLLDQRFHQYADERFKFVVVDFPQTQDGMNAVEDYSQNIYLRDKYSVRILPTVILADADGTPYARIEDVEGSAGSFISELQKLEGALEKRNQLIQAAKEGSAEERFAASLEAAEWLKERSALTFFETDLRNWMRLAQTVDPKNEQGRHEVLFENSWLVSLDQADPNVADDLIPVINQLKTWHATHKFQDHDRAARLHLLAAALLAQLDHVDEAAELITAGEAYQPKDAELAARLRNASKFMATRDQLGSGTGFVIDESGLILTNYHVIEGEGRTTVRISDTIPPLAAEVVDTDKERDIALLKITVPDDVELQPIRLSERSMNRGAEIAAFGYPLGDALGSRLKLTTGVISAKPDVSNENMLLLDLRINPGNSGGPICDRLGNVVGMVTAKSFSGDGVDSYGMAIPAVDLIRFVKQHVESYEPAAVVENPESRPWDQVDEVVNPAVFIVIKFTER